MAVIACPGCGASAMVMNQAQQALFQRQHARCVAPQRQYMGLGDVVAAGIKKVFNVAPCDECQRRQAALNRAVPRVWPRRR